MQNDSTISSHSEDRTLIIGASGKTGRRVAERMAARGHAIRAASRSSEVPFDWNDRSTWSTALDGVSAAYLTYSPDLAVPEAPPAIEAFVKLAQERGVRRLVLLSGRGEEEAQRCEQIALNTNPDWTVVRASWFSQNFSEAFFLEPLRAGCLALPADDIGEPFVDVDDIADVAVAALTEPGHGGQIYEVTGPRLWTFAEAVAEIATATGRELRFEQIPADAYEAGMREHGVPEQVVSLTRYLFETVLDGRNSQVTDGVRRALGRAPRDFSDYVRETAATGIWAAPTPTPTPAAEA
jgi:uncharacterized protein YbjT (DUF2867 family)